MANTLRKPKSKPSTSPEKKAIALIRLIELLQQEEWLASDLRTETGIKEKTLFDYLNEDLVRLQELLEFEYIRTGDPTTYHIKPNEKLKPAIAVVIHAALRMLAHHSPGYNEGYKEGQRFLAKGLPEPAKSIALESARNLSEGRLPSLDGTNLPVITEGWTSYTTIQFDYDLIEQNKRLTYQVNVYFIEVSRANMAVYIIGKDLNYTKAIRTFKLSRMHRVMLVGEPKSYEIEGTFNPADFLSTAWGILAGSDQTTVRVKLKFSPEAARRILEGGFPKLEFDKETLIGEATVGTDKRGFPLEILPWIQSWGPRVEVLEPPNLKERWLEEAREVIDLYDPGGKGGAPLDIQYWAHTPRNKKRRVSATNPPHDLIDHTTEVAELAGEFAKNFGMNELAYISGIWHDLGKFNPDFQSYLQACHVASISGKPAPAKSTPHAIYGATFVFQKYQEQLEALAFLIAGHHAGMPSQGELSSRVQNPEVNEATEEFANLALGAGLALEPKPALLAHLKSMPQDLVGVELLMRFIFSSLVDADYLDTERHFDPAKADLRNSSDKKAELKSLWERLEQFQSRREQKPSEVNIVRAEVLDSCLKAAEAKTGLFRLLVPTGGGKTLSGLAFALKHALENGLERVIFAVPYTSIIDQTVKVYRDIFGVEAVLEHHSASREDSFSDLENADEEKVRAKLATQNWDAPLIVTTTVQLFESLFSNYPNKCRKLHNLSRAVIILDEVQTLPIALLQPIVNVLGELSSERYGSSVVLCTATQPALEVENNFFKGFGAGKVKDIVPTEKVKSHFQRLKRVEYQPNFEPISWDDLAGELKGEPQALVVLNTRKDALKLLDALGQIEVSDVFHLSTLLCGAHRREVLDEVRHRLDPESPKPVILISTQVVEAGVDLDFPTVYRAMGPLERIVQAAGRCNREGKRQSGRVVIFTPAEGGMVTGDYATAATDAVRLLAKGIDLHDPGVFDTYYQILYQGIKTDKHGIQQLRASFDFPKVAEKFNLINDDTKPVAVQYNDTAKDLIERIRKRGFLLASEYRALQPFVVNLRRKEFEANQTLAEEVRDAKDINGVNIWHGSYDRKLRGISTAGWAVEDLNW